LTNGVSGVRIEASKIIGGAMSELERIPEFYSDGIEIGLTMPWTVALTYLLRDTTKERKARSQVIIRMSPEQAKVSAMLLKRLIKNYEHESGCEIKLPGDLYQQLGLTPEDW